MGWVVSITPRPRFTPGERTPGPHCTGGWVGPRAGLDTEARGKIVCPCRGSNPDRPVVQPVVRHYTDWANPAPDIYVCVCVCVCVWVWSPGGMTLRRESRITHTKTCPSATFSTTNSTWTDTSVNHGFRGRKPATLPEPWHGVYITLVRGQ
jgi:hypothetical protein